MSGPALRQLHAHRAIHEGGLSGAVTKTERYDGYLKKVNWKRLKSGG